MRPDMWERKIGKPAWAHLNRAAFDVIAGPKRTTTEDMVAAVLDAAVTAGWRAPEREPKIDPAGLQVLWPPETTPALTVDGLIDFYERRGHGFYILRMKQLLRGVGGFLLPRLQEVLAAYEQQCEHDGVDPLPVQNRIFVGAGRDRFQPLDELVQIAPPGQKPDSAFKSA